MRRSLVYLVGLMFIVGSLALIACNGGGNGDNGDSENGSSSSSNTIAIAMNDQGQSGAYTMVASPATVAAGEITFDVKNEGLIAHEFKVVKLDEAGMGADLADLPTDGGLVSEMGTTVDGVGAILGFLLESDLPAGEGEGLTLDLEPGEYMLLCNVATHYQLGMWSTFTVT